jgi:hypothetical protein
MTIAIIKCNCFEKKYKNLYPILDFDIRITNAQLTKDHISPTNINKHRDKY